jgi:hypothetical protein
LHNEVDAPPPILHVRVNGAWSRRSLEAAEWHEKSDSGVVVSYKVLKQEEVNVAGEVVEK